MFLSLSIVAFLQVANSQLMGCSIARSGTPVSTPGTFDEVGCPDGTVLVGCSVFVTGNAVDASGDTLGTSIRMDPSGPLCRAQAGPFDDGSTVEAGANCCDFNDAVTCNYYTSTPSAATDDAQTSVGCAAGEILVGCESDTTAGIFRTDGNWPGSATSGEAAAGTTEVLSSASTCNGQNSFPDGDGTASAYSICCSTVDGSDALSLECQAQWGATLPQNNGDGLMRAGANCDAGFTAVDCGFQTAFHNTISWAILEDGSGCAIAAVDIEAPVPAPTTPVVTCCKTTTGAPTMTPSSTPTSAPSDSSESSEMSSESSESSASGSSGSSSNNNAMQNGGILLESGLEKQESPAEEEPAVEHEEVRFELDKSVWYTLYAMVGLGLIAGGLCAACICMAGKKKQAHATLGV